MVRVWGLLCDCWLEVDAELLGGEDSREVGALGRGGREEELGGGMVDISARAQNPAGGAET